MNGSSPAIPRWSRHRWVYSVLVALLAQFALLAWLGRGTRFRSAAPAAGLTASLAADSWMAEQIRRLPAYRDPALFALTSEHGFSGPAWLQFTPWENTLVYWSEPASWLELDTNRLARSFDHLLTTNGTPPLLVADKSIIRITGADTFIANQPVPQESSLLIQGPLASRSLETSSALPSWASRDILTPSVVQLTVLASGEPLSAVLLSSSGKDEADRHALQFAARSRFNALDTDMAVDGAAGPPTSGRMVFRWCTLPPDATNTASSPP